MLKSCIATLYKCFLLMWKLSCCNIVNITWESEVCYCIKSSSNVRKLNCYLTSKQITMLLNASPSENDICTQFITIMISVCKINHNHESVCGNVY